MTLSRSEHGFESHWGRQYLVSLKILPFKVNIDAASRPLDEELISFLASLETFSNKEVLTIRAID